MKIKSGYLIIGLAAVVFRLLINFSTDIVPGINGAYYLVQVREIIQHGHMAFSDMPLVFYLESFIVRLVSFILPRADLQDVIMVVTKLLDSILPPLILFPLYFINRNLPEKSLSVNIELLLAAFIVLSFAPIELTAEATKNVIALALMVLYMLFYFLFFKTRKRIHLYKTILSLLVIALCHFGVFVISLAFFFLTLMVFYRKKAWIPVLISLVLGLALVALFDSDRAMRLFFFWKRAFGLQSPRLLFYPQGVINLFFTWYLIILVSRNLKRNRELIPDFERRIMLSLVLFLALLSQPFYDFELGRRFNLMLFVPQTILLILALPYLGLKPRRIMVYIVSILLCSSLALHILHPKPTFITEEAYADFLTINEVLEDPENTIIYARHGLNWWVVWEFNAKMADSHLAVSEEVLSSYEHVLLLTQQKGRNRLYPGQSTPFIDPKVPGNAEVIFSSEYFTMFEYKAPLQSTPIPPSD